MDIISYALSKGNTQKAVTDYLDEHLTNPTNPPIDTSLSIAGAAADSKETGDRIGALKEGLSAMSTASASDVGKALKAKTITDGKVVEWEFGETGVAVDPTLSIEGKAADAKATGDALALRVDKDGTDQVTVRNGEFFNKTYSPNLIDAGKITDGIYINKAGQEVVYDGYQATDFIPVVAGEQYCFSWYTTNGNQRTDATLRFLACYDADKNPIQSAGNTDGITTYPFTIAEGVAYVRLSFTNNTYYSKYQFEKSTAITPYAEYGKILDASIKDEYISALDVVDGLNLLNPNDPNFVDSGFLTVAGRVDSNDQYITSGYIKVAEWDRIVAVYLMNNYQAGVLLRTVACYNADKVVIEAKGAYAVNYFDVPSGVSYVRVCYNKASLGTNVSVQRVAWGESYKPYTPYEAPHGQLTASYMLPIVSAPRHVYLPSDIYVAVGRTIELYNEQIVLDYEKYHFQWICAEGTARKRKFSITGQTVRNLTLTLNLYDDAMNLCWVGRSTIHVVSASNPVKKVLPIGDSLTNWKAWLQETMLLSGNNITFVGTRYSGQSVDSAGNVYPSGEIHSEGRSGWDANNYLTDSSYSFDNRYDGVQSVSGSANPFWDGSKFSLSHYLTTQTGVSTPDAVQIFLGTNDITAGVDTAVTNIVSMVNTIRAEYPNLPIFVCNTIYRSNQNGYGSTGNDAYAGGGNASSWQYDQDSKVMDLAIGLGKALANVSGVYFIPLISCMDREYSFGQVATQVNPRCSVTVDMPAESIHPQACGYYQMADLMYSTYCGVLS